MEQKFLKDFGKYKEGEIVDLPHTTFVKLGVASLVKETKENAAEKTVKQNAKL